MEFNNERILITESNTFYILIEIIYTNDDLFLEVTFNTSLFFITLSDL